MAEKKDQGPAVDVTAILAENEALRAERTAANARQDQMLDMLVELQDQVAQIKTGGTAVAANGSLTAEEASYESDKAALLEEFKDYPGVQVLERRMAEGQNADNDIRLTDEKGVLEDPGGDMRRWQLRWFNFGKEGRAHAAEREGYVKVKWDELRTSESIGSLDRKDEYVRRGDRGQDVLHKIPRKLYELKKRGDRLRQQGLLTSESRLRDYLANSVAAHAGSTGDNADQAGSFVHGKAFQMEITKGPREAFTA